MVKNIIFIKHGDCVSEYRNIYDYKKGQIYDAQEPYLKVIVDFFKNKENYRISIFSIGVAKKHLLPKKNIELNVVKQLSWNKLVKFTDILKTQFILFLHLLKRRPNKILYIADLHYLLAVMIYSFFARKKIYLFLPSSIEKHHVMSRLIVLAGKLFSEVVSRNKRNIDSLRTLGYLKKCDLYYPKYSKPCTSNIIQTELHEDENFKVLFIGRLTFVKGIDVLKQVALKAQNEPISFYIIGDGPYLKELRSFKQKNKLNNLYLLGFIPNREIYSYINSCHIGFIPSKSEGVCKAALEFMLMETPVVASAIGGIPEIVEDGVNGFLVVPNDTNGFLYRIKQLRDDRKLLLHLIKGTLKTKREVLNFDKTLLYQLEKIFR